MVLNGVLRSFRCGLVQGLLDEREEFLVDGVPVEDRELDLLEPRGCVTLRRAGSGRRAKRREQTSPMLKDSGTCQPKPCCMAS